MEPGQTVAERSLTDNLRFCAPLIDHTVEWETNMSAPVQRDETYDSNDARLYAPPWARERPLPAAGQPQYTSSPPVASADDTTRRFAARRAERRRSVGCRRVSAGRTSRWAPKMPPHEEFTGDVAIQALRRRLSLEPDAVPQPPIVVRRDRAVSVDRPARLRVPGGGRRGVRHHRPVGDRSVLTDREQERPLRQRRPDSRRPPSRPTTSTSRPPAWSSRAAAPPPTSPAPLGVSLKDSSGGESVFLSGLENGTRLTAGTPFGSKGWRISARDLGSVLAYAPINYIGAMHAAINLHAANNSVVDTQVVRLEWVGKPDQKSAPQAQQQPQHSNRAGSAAAAGRHAGAPAVGSGGDRQADQARTAVAPGRRYRSGTAAAATRRPGGSAQAALVLGGTYRSRRVARNRRSGICTEPRPRPRMVPKGRWNSAPARRAAGSTAWRRRNANATGGGSDAPPLNVCRPKSRRSRSSGTRSRNGTLLSHTFSSDLLQIGTRPDSQPEL